MSAADSKGVVTIGHKFRGYCEHCEGEVEGEMITGVENIQIEGKDICTTDSIGQGYCGHTCKAIGKSEVFFIEGLPVVREGDPVTDGIEGVLIEGSDFVFSQ